MGFDRINCMFHDKEKDLLTENPSLQIDKTDNYALGSCLGLIDEIENESIDNGVIFLNSQNIEFPLVNLTKQKYGFKRILIIDWDINHNANIQNNFYDNSKYLC